MRRSERQRPEAEAWRLFREAPHVHLAGVRSGRPVLRALHGVVHDDGLVFHGAHEGEKAALLGPVVATAERIVAEIPSHFTHPERACPATTFFRSAMLHGTLVALTDPEAKAAALQALMERFQEAGGYRRITASDPLYTKAIDRVAVWKLVPERVVAKASLGESKTRTWKERALRGLWGDGQVDAVRELADLWELDVWPAPDGVRVVLPGPEHVDAAVELLRDQYWNLDVPDSSVRAAQNGAWVGAVHDGRLVATARAIADGGKLAYIMDVAVHPDWQGRGVGKAVMNVLLDHPRVRHCVRVGLHTKDAGPFYERLGFARFHAPAWREAYRMLR